jgi:hypothetical protein
MGLSDAQRPDDALIGQRVLYRHADADDTNDPDTLTLGTLQPSAKGGWVIDTGGERSQPVAANAFVAPASSNRDAVGRMLAADNIDVEDVERPDIEAALAVMRADMQRQIADGVNPFGVNRTEQGRRYQALNDTLDALPDDGPIDPGDTLDLFDDYEPDVPPAPSVSPTVEDRVQALRDAALVNAGLDSDRWKVTGNLFSSTVTRLQPGDTVRTTGDGTPARPVALPTRAEVTSGRPTVARIVDRVESDGTRRTVHFTDGTSTGPEGGSQVDVTDTARTAVYAAPADSSPPPGPEDTPDTAEPEAPTAESDRILAAELARRAPSEIRGESLVNAPSTAGQEVGWSLERLADPARADLDREVSITTVEEALRAADDGDITIPPTLRDDLRGLVDRESERLAFDPGASLDAAERRRSGTNGVEHRPADFDARSRPLVNVALLQVGQYVVLPNGTGGTVEGYVGRLETTAPSRQRGRPGLTVAPEGVDPATLPGVGDVTVHLVDSEGRPLRQRTFRPNALTPDGARVMDTGVLGAEVTDVLDGIDALDIPDAEKAYYRNEFRVLARRDPQAAHRTVEEARNSIINQTDGGERSQVMSALDRLDAAIDRTGAASGTPGGIATERVPRGEGLSDGAGTLADPIQVGDDLARAAALLAEGKHVRLDQPDQVATLLDRLRETVADAEARGERAPFYDLCKVSVPGTNLFCKQSKGIPRARMPQLSGAVVPGSPAAARADARGRANLGEDFRAALAAKGVSVTRATVKASHLRASQAELDGSKVAEMVRSMRDGTMPDAPIFVSRDGYVIDGHHRWAGKVALEASGSDVDLTVDRIDMEIGEAIDNANAFSLAMGIRPKPGAVIPDDIATLVEEIRATPPKPFDDEEYAAHTARIETVIAGEIAAGRTTDVMHTLDGNGQVWSPDRADLHRQLIDDLWAAASGVPRDGRAVIAGGLGGSGKSTTLGGFAGISGKDYLTINPDDVKEAMAARGMIPEVEGLSPMESSALVHEESSLIANMIGQRAYAERVNVVWDITMSSRGSTERRIDEMRAAGYQDIQGVFVDIPVETSAERALTRHRRGMERHRQGEGPGGRYVPPSIIRQNSDSEFSSANRRVFEELRGRFDGWQSWDNSVTGRDPQPIASSQNEVAHGDLTIGDRIEYPVDGGGASGGVIEGLHRTGGTTVVTLRGDDDSRSTRAFTGDAQVLRLAAVEDTPAPVADVPARDLTVGDWLVLPDQSGQAGVVRVTGVDRHGSRLSLNVDRNGQPESLDVDPTEVLSRADVAVTPGDGQGDDGTGVNVEEPVVDDPGPGDGARYARNLTAGDRISSYSDTITVLRARVRKDGMVAARIRLANGAEDSVIFGPDAVVPIADPPNLPDPTPLDTGVPSARPALATYQRRNLGALNLDDPASGQPDIVREAAARVRARLPLSEEQASALADALRATSSQEGLRPQRRRSRERMAHVMDGVAAQIAGREAPILPGRDTVEKTRAANLTEGDHVAIRKPGSAGGVEIVKVVGTRTIMGGRVREFTVEDTEGNRSTRLLPASSDTYLLPDLAAPSPVIEQRGVEHVPVDRITVGDTIRKATRRPGDTTPVERDLVVTGIRDDADGGRMLEIGTEPTASGEPMLIDAGLLGRNVPTVKRAARGAGSVEQPWDSVLPAETPTAVNHATLGQGDRVQFRDALGREVTGTVINVDPTPGEDGTPGSLIDVREDDGVVGTHAMFGGDTVTRLTEASTDVRDAIQAQQVAADRASEVESIRVSLASERASFARYMASQVGVARTRTEAMQSLIGGGDAYRSDIQIDALARRILGDQADDASVAALKPRVLEIVTGLKVDEVEAAQRSVGNLAVLPGETEGRALVRLSDQLHNSPSKRDLTAVADTLLRAREALGQVRGDSTGGDVIRQVPSIPDGTLLKERMGAYRAALPGKGHFGKRTVGAPSFGLTTLDDLEAGKVPAIEIRSIAIKDRAADGGPSAEAMRHHEVVKAAGADLDADIQRRVADRISSDGFGADPDLTVQQAKERYDNFAAAWQGVVKEHMAERPRLVDEYARSRGYQSGDDLLRNSGQKEERDKARDLRWDGDPNTEIAQRKARLQELKDAEFKRYERLKLRLARARRDATLEALAEIREMGGVNMAWAPARGSLKVRGERDRLVKAMRAAEASYPTDWLQAHHDKYKGSRVLTEVGRGYHRPGGNIALSKGSVQMDDGGHYDSVAVHELGHGVESVVPDLLAAQDAFLWSRTSTGDVGSRERARLRDLAALYPGHGYRATERGREDQFTTAYIGKEYGDRAYEVLTMGMESLVAGSRWMDGDADMRQWLLGALAVL